MHGISWDLVELKLPIRTKKRPVKQTPRRFVREVMSKIKVDIKRLIRNKINRLVRYIKWLANIVPVIKRKGTLKVYIDFINLNVATLKDEYPMPEAEMLSESRTRFNNISLLDGYSNYNQTFIAKEDL